MSEKKRLEILEQAESCTRKIVDTTSQFSGEDYLNALVCSISNVLKAHMVTIAIHKESTSDLQTLAFCQDGELLPNMGYDYVGAPCENVYGKETCSYLSDVADLFPADVFLKEMKIEAYVGIPLFTDKKKNIGVLNCLFSEKLSEDNFVAKILEIFAYRVSSEIQRMDVIKDLLKLNKEYLTLNEQYQIQNEKLEFALEQSRAQEKLKSAFLQNISHEIRTPMNGILGFSNLIESSELTNEELKEYTKYIVSSSNKLLDVVNDILYLSTIESGQVELKETELNLNVLMDHLHKGFEERASEKQLEFTWDSQFADEDSWIIIDEMKLRQVLWNLVVNGIKFTSSGFVKFGYRLKDKHLVFFVKDSGIGIDESMRSNIFKPFHQVDSSTQRKFEGIGLGLSICKGYVKNLGGKIWFNSELKKGTSIFFTIPYKKA